ncbi:MAG: hypothetical protein IT385_11030 [Deltaproteobacteria bacterium]|nr:hypothetical protein [Deltaproteobacteria bacterium]
MWETFEVEAGGPSSGLLLPGRVLRALAQGAEVPAEDVGVMLPGKRGSVLVEIARHHAARLATPRSLPSLEGESVPAVFVLRRPDDEPDPDARRELLVSWDDDGAAPSPGALAAALADATGGAADELGFGLAGARYVRVQVPLGLVLRGLPATLTLSEPTPRVLSLDVIDGGAPKKA